MSNGFAKLTDADTDKQILVLMGNGGGIKAVRFDEDSTTEIYNGDGEMVAKVKETVDQIAKNV